MQNKQNKFEKIANPWAICLIFILTSDIFFKTILCFLFSVNCVKVSEYYSYIVYRRQCGIYQFQQIPEVLGFPLPMWANLPPKAAENGLPRHFALPFPSLTLQRNFKNIFRIPYYEMVPLIPWAEQLLFKVMEMIC